MSNNERTTRRALSGSSLLINKTVYHCYEGLNLIGRNKEAVVNIKDIKISQNHAAVIAMDNGDHYICDFNSSNGTLHKEVHLSPFKLYKLEDGDCIYFANILAVYRVGSHSNFDSQSTQSTQSNELYEAHTQIIENQTLRSMPCQDEKQDQLIDIENLPGSRQNNTETHSKLSINNLPNEESVLGDSIHEMETQVMQISQFLNKASEETVSLHDQASINFHEAPTQVCTQGNLWVNAMGSRTDLPPPAPPLSFSDSDDLATKISREDAETSATEVHDNTDYKEVNQSQNNEVIEETLYDNGSVSNDSDDFLMMQKAQEVEDSLQEAESQLHVSQLKHKKRILLDSEDEDDTVKSSMESAFMSKPLRERNIIGPVIDEESEITQNPEPNEVAVEEKQATRTVDSDSETDIEDAEPSLVTEKASKSPLSDPEEALNDTDVIPATQEPLSEVFNYDKKAVTETMNDHLSAKVELSEDSFRLGLTELMDESEKFQSNCTSKRDSDSYKSTTQQFMNDATTCLQSTQVKRNDECNKAEKQPNIPNTECTQGDPGPDFYMLATQKVDINTSSNTQDVVVSICENIPLLDNDYDNDIDHIYIESTQKIATKSNNDDSIFIKPLPKIQRSCNNLKNQSRDEEEIYLEPTQKLPAFEHDKTQRTTVDEDVYLQPTQKLDLFHSETDSNESHVHAPETQKFISDANIDSITKELEIERDKTSSVIGKNHELKVNYEIDEVNEKVESQLEVSFPSQNVKLLNNFDTRPANPLISILEGDTSFTESANTDEDNNISENSHRFNKKGSPGKLSLRTKKIRGDSVSNEHLDDCVLENDRKIAEENASNIVDNGNSENLYGEDNVDNDSKSPILIKKNKNSIESSTDDVLDSVCKDEGNTSLEKEGNVDNVISELNPKKDSETKRKILTDINDVEGPTSPMSKVMQLPENENDFVNECNTRKQTRRNRTSVLPKIKLSKPGSSRITNSRIESGNTSPLPQANEDRRTSRRTTKSVYRHDSKKETDPSSLHENDIREEKVKHPRNSRARVKSNQENEEKTGLQKPTKKNKQGDTERNTEVATNSYQIQESKTSTTNKIQESKRNSKYNLDEFEEDFTKPVDINEGEMGKLTFNLKRDKVSPTPEDNKTETIVSESLVKEEIRSKSSISKRKRHLSAHSEEEESASCSKPFSVAEESPSELKKRRSVSTSENNENVHSDAKSNTSSKAKKSRKNSSDSRSKKNIPVSEPKDATSTTSSSKRSVAAEEAKNDSGSSRRKRNLPAAFEPNEVTSSGSCNTPSKSRKTNSNDVPLLSPERSKRMAKPKVVFTLMESPELESAVRQLGGSIVDTINACTVLVTEKVKRTQKLLTAIGLSKPICSPNWIRESKISHKFLDTADFILSDPEAEEKWNFSLCQSLERSANKKLLDGYTFHILVNNAAEVLRGAIEACGGKCVNKVQKNNLQNFYVVSSPDCKNKYLKVKKQHSVPVIEAEAIFDGVLRQELRFEKHLLE